MTTAQADGGSFRDPGGRIFDSGDRILRTVMPSSAAAYEVARDSGLYCRLIERGLLVASTETDGSSLPDLAEAPAYVLSHPRIPFVSYPYEWSFALHRRAALHHLDVQLAALADGFTLSDATAYNIQFIGSKPVFIDHLSFKPYRDGEVWIGHRQFCAQFLNPLIFWSRLGIPPNPWFRGSLEGIPPEYLSPLLSWRDNLSWTILSHVTAQAAVQNRLIRSGGAASRAAGARLPRRSFEAMLLGLRQFVERCRLRGSRTVWSDYAARNSYAGADAAAKRAFVGEMVSAARPRLLFDLGCNSGDYSIAALEAGASTVVGFDYDFGALELAARRSADGEFAFLPLWLDAANPSPSQGWAQSERKGLAERAPADALIALAFLHHIVIGRNVPLAMALGWLMDLAPVGVIEFVPKSDPMVQLLLAHREDIFPDYDEANFLSQVGQRARIVNSVHLTPKGRLLVRYDKTESA